MVAPKASSGPADLDSNIPPERLSALNPSTLARVKDAANSIAMRVRHTLTQHGFAPVRVLVVDDHPDAAESLAVVVEMLGCPVLSVTDGPSALAAVEEFRPDVCLLDLMMPKMDGLELASRLKAWASGRPLLLAATTALEDPEIKARAMLAGFHDYLVKPVNIPALVDFLTRVAKFVGPSDPPPSAETGEGEPAAQ